LNITTDTTTTVIKVLPYTTLFRSLNVAITRAKYNVKLVGSILPTDIDVDRVSAEGPKLLRSYIDFAINGIDSLQREVTESDIVRSEEHTSELQSRFDIVCRLLLEK